MSAGSMFADCMKMAEKERLKKEQGIYEKDGDTIRRGG